MPELLKSISNQTDIIKALKRFDHVMLMKCARKDVSSARGEISRVNMFISTGEECRQMLYISRLSLTFSHTRLQPGSTRHVSKRVNHVTET